jgi:hypothetical protein
MCEGGDCDCPRRVDEQLERKAVQERNDAAGQEVYDLLMHAESDVLKFIADKCGPENAKRLLSQALRMAQERRIAR